MRSKTSSASAFWQLHVANAVPPGSALLIAAQRSQHQSDRPKRRQSGRLVHGGLIKTLCGVCEEHTRSALHGEDSVRTPLSSPDGRQKAQSEARRTFTLGRSDCADLPGKVDWRRAHILVLII